MFEKMGQNIVFKAIEAKIHDINPQELIEVFEHLVSGKLVAMKRSDDDKDGLSNYEEAQTELKAIGKSALRIKELIETAK